MNKFLAFLLSFSILNSSFAEDLLCPCCYNNYFKNYQDGKSFATDGLDVYVVDDFTDYNFFNNYYSPFFDKDEEDLFLPKERYNIDVFFQEEDPSNELHFSSHKKPWYYHLYKKEEDNDFNENLVTTLAKKMSTEGGNNFDWEKGVDKVRWFNRFRSKVRHNKNVIIVKLENAEDNLFEKTIYTFRKFVNMSYRPVPIIFTGNFEYKDFEENLKKINEDYTEKHGKDQNGKITVRGVVDKTQHIESQECFYIQQEEDFVEKVKKELEKASFYHNFKEIKFNEKTLNIAIIGLPRSGKSLCTNIILDNLSAKIANDVTSVTQGRTTHFHSNVKDIPIQIVDTAGFELNKENDVNSFISWLQDKDEENSNKKRINDIHVVVYFINATNFPKPENFGGSWTDSSGRSRGNEFYLEDEIKLFKIFKDNKVPVIFCIAQSGSFENGYKYLKKWFGDLALINDLSNYQSNDENWKTENQWICPKWTRGTVIQLKNDSIDGPVGHTGKYGLIKLVNIIKELFETNDNYKSRLPQTFAGNYNLNDILEKLKEQFKRQEFNDDTNEGPIIVSDEDLIVNKVDKKIPECLNFLHKIYYEQTFLFKLCKLSGIVNKLINKFAKSEFNFDDFEGFDDFE